LSNVAFSAKNSGNVQNQQKSLPKPNPAPKPKEVAPKILVSFVD